jgi:hypothetical protein
MLIPAFKAPFPKIYPTLLQFAGKSLTETSFQIYAKKNQHSQIRGAG